jgi:hypothetical protein
VIIHVVNGWRSARGHAFCCAAFSPMRYCPGQCLETPLSVDHRERRRGQLGDRRHAVGCGRRLVDPIDLRPSHSPVPGHRPCRIARFARGTGVRGVETASRLHLKTGLKFDIAYRNAIGHRAGRTGFDWVAGPISPQLVQRLAFIIYTGLEIRRCRAAHLELGAVTNRHIRL